MAIYDTVISHADSEIEEIRAVRNAEFSNLIFMDDQ